MNNAAGMRLATGPSRSAAVRAAAIGMLAPKNGRSVGVGGTGLFVDLGTGLDTPNARANASVAAGANAGSRAKGGAGANGGTTRDDRRVAALGPAAPGVRGVVLFIHR